MILPLTTDGRRPVLPDSSLAASRQIVIIGANGAGKSRFADSLLHLCDPDKVFRISALHALFSCNNDFSDDDGVEGVNPAAVGTPPPQTCPDCHNSIDLIFCRKSADRAFLTGRPHNSFDRLTILLLNDEISHLVRYKASSLTGRQSAASASAGDDTPAADAAHSTSLPRTRLDRVLSMWSRIFPDNSVLRDGASLLFKDDINGDSPRSLLRLSDGEKAVLYNLGAVTYAPPGGIIFVDNPGMFLHPSITASTWNTIEQMRPDCTFVYTTHDLDFASTRTSSTLIWVKSCRVKPEWSWDYSVIPPQRGIPDQVYLSIIGARKPVLFIEGDPVHSIDAKLYPLIFHEYTIKPLGGCDRVIEATRTFNSLKSFHHLLSRGIVDRDRRDELEISYLRNKEILVPEVAEIENLLLLPGVVKAVARHCHREPDAVFDRVKDAVISMFASQLHEQALQHTRHRVKRAAERGVDRRFTSIGALESHLNGMANQIKPRQIYQQLCHSFSKAVEQRDYLSVLKFFNHKSMLTACGVTQLCGLTETHSGDAYLRRILRILSRDDCSSERQDIIAAVRTCFTLSAADTQL